MIKCSSYFENRKILYFNGQHRTIIFRKCNSYLSNGMVNICFKCLYLVQPLFMFLMNLNVICCHFSIRKHASQSYRPGSKGPSKKLPFTILLVHFVPLNYVYEKVSYVFPSTFPCSPPIFSRLCLVNI